MELSSRRRWGRLCVQKISDIHCRKPSWRWQCREQSLGDRSSTNQASGVRAGWRNGSDSTRGNRDQLLGMRLECDGVRDMFKQEPATYDCSNMGCIQKVINDMLNVLFRIALHNRSVGEETIVSHKKMQLKTIEFICASPALGWWRCDGLRM